MALAAFIESPEELAALAANAQSQYADDEQPEEPQHKFFGLFGRDYEPDLTAFADQMCADGAPLPSQLDIARMYGNELKRRELEQEAEEAAIAECNRRKEAERIASDCVRFTSSIKSHLAFDKIHAFVNSLRSTSRPSYGSAELSADVWIAARHALKDEPMLWEFYKLWASGAAADIPAKVLAKSEHWYRVRSLVGAEIIRRELLNGYFKRTRHTKEERTCLALNSCANWF